MQKRIPRHVIIRTDRDHSSLKRKRCLPISHGITHVSRFHYLETYPSSNGTPGISQPDDGAYSIIWDLKEEAM